MRAIKLNYSAAYDFANRIISVTDESIAEEDEIIADFFYFRLEAFFKKIAKPQKRTLLHDFIFTVNHEVIEREIGKYGAEATVQTAGFILSGADFQFPAWFTEEEIDNNIVELNVMVENAVHIITEPTFHLLFSNRTFLFEFNKLISRFIKKLHPEESDCIRDIGVIKRSRIPTWLRRAVFHRDKGHCQLCGTNLTNLMVPIDRHHLDHMVPLAAGGSNDPTNFQLTCVSCNSSKGATILSKDHLTFPFW